MIFFLFSLNRCFPLVTFRRTSCIYIRFVIFNSSSQRTPEASNCPRGITCRHRTHFCFVVFLLVGPPQHRSRRIILTATPAYASNRFAEGSNPRHLNSPVRLSRLLLEYPLLRRFRSFQSIFAILQLRLFAFLVKIEFILCAYVSVICRCENSMLFN